MLKGGHADNALPQSATATVNCRIMPGVAAQGSAGGAAADGGPEGRGHTRPELHRRADAGNAAPARGARRGDEGDPALPWPADARLPDDAAGASDGSFFRAQGIPVYDMDGSWGIAPLDDRMHGLDERTPVRSMYDDVVYWTMIIKSLAG